MNRSRIPRQLRPHWVGLFATMLLISTTLAASSANYAIYWEQAVASGGEGRTSTNYKLDSTIGLPLNGVGSSSSYVIRLGYVPVQGAILTATPTLAPGQPTSTPAPTNTPQPTNTPGGPTDTATITPAPTDTPAPPTATAGGATPTDCADPFTDLGGNIFRPAIDYLYCRGIVNGTGANTYSPAGISTRAQFAKVVVLGFGIADYTPATPTFSDVPASYFAYAYIESGYHAGILSGYNAGTCGAAGAQFPCYLPGRPITRAQLTKLVVGAAQYPPFTPTTPTFVDVGTNNIFYASIETAHHMGVINGYPDNTFRPNNNIRRDEMAQIVYKAVTTP